MLSEEWLSRLQGNGPWLATMALAVLIAVELARALIALLGGTPVKSPMAVQRPIPIARRAGVDIQGLVGSHLFGISAAEPSAEDPANAPQTTANLILAGTIATEDPKHGVAIITDGGPSKVYTVGENVGGATLHSVYLDHVVLNRAGTLETLPLPHLLLTGMQSPPKVNGADSHTAAAVDNLRRMVQADPGILNQVMRTVASYDNVAGKLRGFRAYPGRNRQAFNKLGLRPGDLVTAINGTPLDDPQRGQEILNTIQTQDRATVTIERAGQKQDISLNVAQVATQAARDLENDPGSLSSAPAGVPPPGNGDNAND